ncbi:MAG: hypothetical protein U1A72_10545 [Sulfuritalea sp.]|nr:hypothetical protein [Sulfuritalea sp.]
MARYFVGESPMNLETYKGTKAGALIGCIGFLVMGDMRSLNLEAQQFTGRSTIA